MFRSSSIGRLLWVAVALFDVLGCSPSDSSILLTVSNLPMRATSLQLTGTLDGKPAMMPQTVTLPLAQNLLAVQLPAVAAGHLILDLQAIDSDHCSQGTARPELDVTAGNNLLNVPLTTQSPRKCGSLAPCAMGVGCVIPSSGTTSSIRSIWTIAPNDIWAVGAAAAVLHYDGNSWTATPTSLLPVPPTTRWNGVWASASNDVWVVGTAGRVIHYDGTKWATSNIGAQRDLQSISGISSQSIWTVGLSSGGTTLGEFWHWNGSTWTAITPYAKGNLNTVLAVNPNLVMVGGGDDMFFGLLWAMNGAGTFTNYSPAAVVTVNGLWASSPTRILAVGLVGEILIFDGSKWTIVQNTISEDFHGVTNDGNFTYIVGTRGLVERSSDPTLKNLTPITGLPTADLWTLQLASNGLAWFAGDTGVLGYLDTRP